MVGSWSEIGGSMSNLSTEKVKEIYVLEWAIHREGSMYIEEKKEFDYQHEAILYRKYLEQEGVKFFCERRRYKKEEAIDTEANK